MLDFAKADSYSGSVCSMPHDETSWARLILEGLLRCADPWHNEMLVERRDLEETVANIKSAQKRIQTAERNRLRNKSYRSAVKTLTKHYLTAVEAYVAEPGDDAKKTVQDRMSEAYSKIDKAVKRGVYHKNTGANKKSNIAKLFKLKVEPYNA